ncbi:MAG TPA: hypothetical protein VK535_02060, partial [Gemmatimonadales bacterium]|nr:hypothetical protein [Gemmatimonadales bacterium]
MGGIIYQTPTLQRGLRALLTSTLLGMSLAGAACREHTPESGSIRVVDDAGDTVRLQSPARRVVSLIPASTELLFA